MTSNPEPHRPAPRASFSYSNVNTRPPGRFLPLARRVSTGIDKVERQIPAYAANWQERNAAAFAESGPLWVVLGDSLSQSVGASSIEQGWVLQALRLLAAGGLDYRVINLSISGATILDVLNRQLPALDALAATPALVTLLIGSNDLLHHKLRAVLPVSYQALLSALPDGAFIAVPDRAPGVLGEMARVVEDEARSGRVHAVRVHLSTPLRAEDHFHLNDQGYALVARDFAGAILLHGKAPS